MFKRSMQLLVIFMAIIGFAGLASARVDINLYGASAQFLYWNDAADNFLTGLGCSGVKQATDSGGKTHGITTGECDLGSGTETVYIRYTSKASYDGIYACIGDPNVPGGQPSCASTGPRYREMADPNGITWAPGGATKKACYKVTLGCSDVAGTTFGQYSEGQLKGHKGGGWITRYIPPIPIPCPPICNPPYRPLVVPFGFFANKAVQNGGNKPVDNLTTLQAIMVFSGDAWNWADFDPNYPVKDIIACLRHAGSGTHATLDAAVFRADGTLLTTEAAPYVYFNDGSGDMMKCIDENAGEDTGSFAAVGYADADQSVGANTHAINYNGAPASKNNIMKGVHSFWSYQNIYECEASDPAHALVVELMDFASDPANLPASKAAWWAAVNEMNVEKANDFAFPVFIH